MATAMTQKARADKNNFCRRPCVGPGLLRSARPASTEPSELIIRTVILVAMIASMADKVIAIPIDANAVAAA